jgi:transposase
MHDKELYSQVLGLASPWKVKEVQLSLDEQRVDIWIEWPEGRKVMCPDCERESIIYDHAEEREWRHLDTCQFKTILRCSVPRVRCEEHGVVTMKVPWAEPHARFTMLFERFAIDMLQACQNRTKGQNILKISWDELNHIMFKAVKRGMGRRKVVPIRYVGIDEKNFRRGRDYVTIMSDLDRGCVIDVAETNKTEAIDSLWQAMPKIQRDGIVAVAMDMWEAFINSTRANVKQADIVHDKFHIASKLGDAVNDVRKKEHALLLEGNIATLTGTKFLWLKNPERMTKDQKKRFKELQIDQLAVGRAWNLKELFRHFWGYVYENPARGFFKRWYFAATHSRLTPIIKVAKTIKNHFEDVITYLKHHITNAFAEGINSKIQQVKMIARGFRGFANYRIAILFYCGKLDLYPR